MIDLDARLEAEHADLAHLPHAYTDLHRIWDQVAVTRTPAGVPSRRMPTSRWPAGRDPESASRLAKATLWLTIAHGWCRAWRWPARPWTGMESAGLTGCRVCRDPDTRRSEGWLISVDRVSRDGVEVATVTEVLHCWPCDTSGLARHDLGTLTLLPPHPHIIRTVTDQLRGYLAALSVETLYGYDLPPLRELLAACRQARLAVGLSACESKPVRVCASGCGRWARDGRTLCHRCEKQHYRSRAA